MRLRRADLRGRVNADLEFRFRTPGLTSYAGLELLRRYCRARNLVGALRRYVVGHVPASDFGVPAMLMVVLTLLVAGGRRLRHLAYLQGDPIVHRLCGLKRLPTARSVGRWLSAFRAEHLPWVQEVNARLVAAGIRALKLRRLTIDVDGSVVSTGPQVQWAQRGYNPLRRNRPSYYPITAYEARSGQVLRVHNRPGNIYDGKAALGFLRALFAQLAATLGSGYQLEFRMDGAFFLREVVTLLERCGAEYAIKVPLYPWLNLKTHLQSAPPWTRVDELTSCTPVTVPIARWARRVPLMVFRKRVQHQGAKHFQLDLFDPTDGHYEYSAVLTNKTIDGAGLWAFMCGRGMHEKAYAELKSGFAFDCVPSMRYAANSLWQLLSVMAFNLVRGFQAATTAVHRAATPKQTGVWRFESIHSLRYQYFHRAGVIVRPGGSAMLDIGRSPDVADSFQFITERLKRVALLSH